VRVAASHVDPLIEVRNVIVREVARAAGVSPEAVRFYARIGLLQPSRDHRNGYRTFSEWDVRVVRFTKSAQGLGFTLAEIKTLVSTAKDGATPCPMVREVIARRVAETDRELDAMVALRDRMADAVRRWRRKPDRLPDGNAICHLIEST
jgi:DNA-binding transcriptional MerR regulator